MRLLFVANYFPQHDSSVFRIHDFARFLVSTGNSVSVVTRIGIRDVFRVKAGEEINNIRVYRALNLDYRLGTVVLDVFEIVSTFLLTFAVALREKVDFIIISVPPGILGIGPFLAGRMLRKKVVFDVRDKWEDRGIYFSKYRLVRWNHVILKKLFDVFYRKAKVVFTVTQSLVEYLKARCVSRVVFIPNGADVKLFYPRKRHEKLAIRSELKLPEEDILLVYAGAIGGYYRLDVVIEALNSLIRNNDALKLKFIVMGMGESHKIDEMLKLIRNLGLQNDVIFLGEKKREVVARVLSCCDVGIVPYDDKPLWVYAHPGKFFDYCASGLPVVATAFQSSELASLIRIHRVGCIVEPLDSIELASTIGKFYNLGEKERRDMSERARSLVLNTFDRVKIANKLKETLQGVLE
jgi:glycosyltransferase involved in cell wall biosynthesis